MTCNILLIIAKICAFHEDRRNRILDLYLDNITQFRIDRLLELKVLKLISLSWFHSERPVLSGNYIRKRRFSDVIFIYI